MKDIERLVASKKSLIEALADLAPFVDQMNLGFGPLQKPAVAQEVIQLADIVGFMPCIASAAGDCEIAYLHYAIGDVDYYITYRDRSPEQNRAFGVIVRGERVPEVDYISIREIVRAGARLDLDWKPIPLGQVQTPLLS